MGPMGCFFSFLAVFRANSGNFCSFGIRCRLRFFRRIMCFWGVFYFIFYLGVVKMQYPCESRGLRGSFGGSHGGVCADAPCCFEVFCGVLGRFACFGLDSASSMLFF